MAARFDRCRKKGFDAVEPDLLDGCTDRTGFPLTGADRLRHNRVIAALAHERGPAAALKNDLEQVPQPVGRFDFAVDESCAEFGECARLSPFVRAGKPVPHVEYNLTTAQFCRRTEALGFSSTAEHLKLDAWRRPC
nr:endo alpha-1,4 polygalactosaminidase [Saccharothrix sp. ST-888]